MKFLLCLFVLLAGFAPAAAEERDWGVALRMDATALHDAIAANHPGPINPADPDFVARNDGQLARALERAGGAKTFADYFYALQEYTASFDDGHMTYGVYGATPDEVRKWPGFLARYDDRGNQIVYAAEPWSGVQLGSRVVSCDGLSANEVARKRFGSRVGRWDLASQRMLFGAFTFLDLGDPYVGEIRECRFRRDGADLDVVLKWRVPEENIIERYGVFPRGETAKVELRQLPNGTQWLALPSFNGDPDSPAGAALRAMIAELGKRSDEIRTAPAIVLDLRGNGGGSSDWSYQIAARLWGESEIDRHPQEPMTVSWRASAGNLEYVRQMYAERSQGGHLSPELINFYETTIAGLANAIATHEDLWVIQPSPAAPSETLDAGPVHRLTGPVYILTDSFCMSACLDAVDLWTRLGAIPVGQETGADTLYLEARIISLPAGVGSVTVPMKVYSGRARGSNQTVAPKYRFEGDMADTGALERWVATLPERGKVSTGVQLLR